MEREDKLDELFITDAGAKLAVEQVAGGLSQWRLVNFVDGLVKRFNIEQTVFHSSRIILEPLINAAASAGGFAKLGYAANK